MTSPGRACTWCALGTFGTELGLSSCVSCEAGSYFTGLGSTACIGCAVGTYSTGTGLKSSAVACKGCAAGTYGTVSGSSSCVSCSEGTFFTGLSSSACMDCVAGTYGPTPGLSSCIGCRAGMYSTGTGLISSECVDCETGSYSTRLGLSSSACMGCATGTYGTDSGLSSCASCATGTFSTGSGLSNFACMGCVEGTYGTGSALSSCVSCRAGSYSTGLGSSVCIGCATDAYSTGTGLSSCVSCAAGSFSAGLGSTLCTLLPGQQLTTQPAVSPNSVAVVVKLPMSKADFEAKQALFIAALAASFGAPMSLVHIQSVAEVITRYLRFPARRLLGTAVSVSSTVESSNRVDQSSLSQQLVAFGLPSPTSIDILYPSGKPLSSSLTTSSPALNDSLTTSSASSGGLPLAVIGAIGGGGGLVVVLLGTFFWYRTRGSHEAAPGAAGGHASTATSGAYEFSQSSGAAPATSTITNRDQRHLHLVDGDDLKGAYQPMVRYAQRPNISCLNSIRASFDALGIPDSRFSQALGEMERITDSRVDDPDAQQLLSGFSPEDFRSHILAIVMYTFDFCKLLADHKKEDNFYYKLNQLLRKRNAVVLGPCTPYLYYLMHGLEALPSFPTDKVLWRGVDSAGREKLLRNYTIGRVIYWSGFSSASLDQSVAEEFAGPGGLLLQVQLVDKSLARDIKALSAFPCEDEILLLPNFCARVARQVRKVVGHDGVGTWDMLELLEDVKSSLPAHHS